MADYLEYGCGTLSEHEQVACGAYPKGGISAIGILEADHTITDFTNASQYTTNIANGNLRIIDGIRGTVPDPSPVEVDNPVGCGPDTLLAGFNWTATWMDANANAENISFYSQLNNRVTYLILFLCGSDEVMVVEQATNYIANSIMVPASNKELQMFNVTARASIKQDELPMKYTAPSGIFTLA
jgi:hypothetical protein